MTREMTMTCSQGAMTKCVRPKMDSPRINGNHQTMKPLEDFSQRMTTRMKRRESRTKMRTMMRKALSRMTMMMAVTIISDHVAEKKGLKWNIGVQSYRF